MEWQKSHEILPSSQRDMNHKSRMVLRRLTLESQATGAINEGLKSSKDWNLDSATADWLLDLRQILV